MKRAEIASLMFSSSLASSHHKKVMVKKKNSGCSDCKSLKYFTAWIRWRLNETKTKLIETLRIKKDINSRQKKKLHGRRNKRGRRSAIIVDGGPSKHVVEHKRLLESM